MWNNAPKRNSRQINPFLKLALDLGPLLLFFIANQRFGIFAATGVFMVAVLVALAVSYALTRQVAIMPIVTAVVVLVFGGLTLILQDETFIKLKPTIIYLLFGGDAARRAAVRQAAARLSSSTRSSTSTDEGWRKLTLRWIVFFFALAVLNEIVWRTQTTDFWVNFKVFGFCRSRLCLARCSIRC